MSHFFPLFMQKSQRKKSFIFIPAIPMQSL